MNVTTLARRIASLVGVARIKLIDDTGPVQMAQLHYGETVAGGSDAVRDKTPVLLQYGLASNPPADADVTVLHVAGDRSAGVVIAVGHQTYRLKNLNPGEAALYDQWGNTVVLAQAGIIITHTAKIHIAAPLLEVTGNIVDNCGSNTKSLKDLRDAYDAHKHTGVTTGAGLTGLTDHNV